MRISRLAAVGFLLLGLMMMAITAQTTTGRLEGVVNDASGAIIPGAKVTAVNIKNQQTLETLTNEAGVFVFAAVQPGTYTVSAELQGFKKEIHTNVIVNVAFTVSETFKLEVGGVSESVTVEANIERINTTDGQVARAITMRDIDVLPLLGRAPIQLAVFQTGVQIAPNDVTFSVVNGLRQGSNNAKLDGIDVNDAVVPRMGLSMTANNTDSVGEFRVVTNGGKAEYGRSAGAQVEMITRSGSNRWSGNAYDYWRNTILNANNFFNNSSGVAVPNFKQHQFGTSLGGPVIKDKTFIFGNYQGRRTKQDTVRNRTVLTSLAKRGIFQWKDTATGAIKTFDIVANDPRKIGIDKVVAANLALLPDPNNTDLGDGLNTAGFRFNNPSGSMEDQMTIRADHQLTSNNRIFYRHSWQRNSSLDALNNADSTYPGQPSGTQGGHRWGIAIGDDWVITPRFINEFRYGHQSAGVDFVRVRPPQALIQSNLFTDPINTAFAQGRNSPVNEWTDNITFTRTKHTFKAGLNIRFTTQYGYNMAGAWANISLGQTNGNQAPGTIGPTTGISSTDRTTFNSLYNDVLGRMSSTTLTYYSDLAKFQPAGSGRIRNFKFHEYGFFLQDDWRVRPNFTLNLGLRWEFNGVPYETEGFQGTLDQAAAITSDTQISNLTVQRSSKWYNNDWNNFGPRFGFAWAPGGNSKTSVRGGWGLYYDRIIGATTSLVDGNTPGFSQSGIVYPNVTGTTDVRVGDGIPIAPLPAAPSLTLPNSRSFSVVVFDPNLKNGYVHHFNLSIQRELLKNTILEVGYVGTRGIKLFMDRNLNQAKVDGDFLTAFRQLQAFRTSGTAVPAGNTLVKIFGSVSAAITGVGGNTTVDNGLVGTAAGTNVDRTNYTKYAAAGVSDYYLRNFPQFNQLIYGGNDGRSYYNSLQVSLRRQAGALKTAVNYTWSKSIDNGSIDGNGFTSPINSRDTGSNRARGDNDRPHSLNYSIIYTLPFGRGQWLGGNLPGWADRILGGWDMGITGVVQSGGVMTISSGRSTYNPDVSSWAVYDGDRTIGKVNKAGNGAGGVYYFTQNEMSTFSFPVAGSLGTAGRNTFRGPRYVNTDVSLVKAFRITETHRVSLRMEGYNIFNHANFSNPSATYVTTSAFGRISSTISAARIFQLALRYDF